MTDYSDHDIDNDRDPPDALESREMNPWNGLTAGIYLFASEAMHYFEKLREEREARLDERAIDSFENEGGAIHECYEQELISRGGILWDRLPNGRELFVRIDHYEVFMLLRRAARGEDIREAAKAWVMSDEIMERLAPLAGTWKEGL